MPGVISQRQLFAFELGALIVVHWLAGRAFGDERPGRGAADDGNGRDVDEPLHTRAPRRFQHVACPHDVDAMKFVVLTQKRNLPAAWMTASQPAMAALTDSALRVSPGPARRRSRAGNLRRS